MATVHRSRTRGLIAAAALVPLLFFGFAAPAAHAGTTDTLYIFNFGFGTQAGVSVNPTIQVGDTVEWIWESAPTPHSTTSVAGIAENWDSGVTSVNGTTFDHTFTNVGTFAYYCQIHGFDKGDQTAGGMSGTITVVPAAAPEPSAFAGLALGVLGLAGLIGRARLRLAA